MSFDLYTRLYLWLAARRPMVLLLTLLVIVVSIAISSRIRLEEDILDTLPTKDRLVDDYRYSLRKFRQIDRVFLDVGISNDDPDTLSRAADEVFTALSTNSSFIKITYRFDLSGQARVIDYLTGALPNLFTESDAAELEKKIAPAEIRKFLTVMRRKLAGPEGMLLKNVVAADPVASSALVLNKVMPLQVAFGDAQIQDGRITSADGRHVLLLAEPRFRSSNSGESEAMVRDLLLVAARVEHQFYGIHVAITGGHRMSVDNATLIKSDASRCILLGMAAMLVLCVTAFRRRWLAAVTFLPSFFGTTMAGVVLALWSYQLSAIATGFAVIAIGITVDYAIYVIYHLDNAAGLDAPAVGWHIGRLVLPISVGALTTMAAFVVMATSSIRGYQQLGVFGAVGVLFSAAFALLVLPLIVPIPKQSGQPPLWLTLMMGRFHHWQKSSRPWIMLVMVAMTILAVFGLKRLHFEGDLVRLNGITPSTRHDDEIIRKVWGDALGMTLVVARSTNVDDALAQNDLAASRLSQLPGIKATYSLASVCPSRATQERNISRWREFWSPGRQNTLAQTLQQVGGELGFQPDAFDAFWQRIRGKQKLLTPQTFRGTPLEQALSERIAIGTNDTAVSTLVKLDDRSMVPRLREALPGMIVLDQKDFVDHIASLSRSNLGHFALWTGIIVAAIVYFALGSVELLAAVLLPLGFGLLWTFGLMGWLGLPIDIMNSVFVIFIIGIGEDYCLFLVTSKLDEWRGRPQRLAATSASVLISALTTIFGFAVLVFARHPALFSMGTTVLIGMGFAFAATLVLTPLYMELLLFKDPPRGAPRWWHPLATLWVIIHLGGSQVFLYFILRPILKIISWSKADARLRRATRWMARGVVKGLPFGKLEFRNITQETFSPPCVVISNHQSAVDVMLVVSLPGDVRQTAKKRVFDAPMLGIGCKILGHVMVEPNDPQTTLQRCRQKLAAGACVHFYPEGTRSRDGFIERFHRGAFELAVALNQEILPIILCDTNTAMPRDSYWFEPFHSVVRALPRITPETFDYSNGSLALMRHCQSIVREALQNQLDILNTPKVVRRKVNRLYRYQGKFVELFVHWKMRTDPLFDQLDVVVPRRGHILDLGCGYGIASHWLSFYTDKRTFLGIDYDPDKIRVAQRTAPGHPRIQFEQRDILNWEYPACDVVLLLDVLHYWTPEKQHRVLRQARRALRPGGLLVLRDAASSESSAHRRIHFWEKIATTIGHNKTEEGLHFQTLTQMQDAVRLAGFARVEVKHGAGRGSNLLLVALTEPTQCSDEQIRGTRRAAA